MSVWDRFELTDISFISLPDDFSPTGRFRISGSNNSDGEYRVLTTQKMIDDTQKMIDEIEINRYGRTLAIMMLHTPPLSINRLHYEHHLEFKDYGPTILVDDRAASLSNRPLMERLIHQTQTLVSPDYSSLEFHMARISDEVKQTASEIIKAVKKPRNNPVFLGTSRSHKNRK